MTAPRTAGALQGSILVGQSVFPAMGAVLLVPVVPLLFREYGQIEHAEYLIPALLTVPGLCIALFSPLVGWLADRIGRRPLLISGLLFYGAAGIAPLFLTSFAEVLVSRIILGVGDAIIIVVTAVMVGDYFEGARRARWLALFGTVAAVAAAVFLALGGILGDAFGWRGAVSVYALSLVFIPAMLLYTWEQPAPAEMHECTERPPARGLALHLAVTGITTLFGAVLFYTLVLQQGLALAALGTMDPGRLGMLTAIASLGNPIASLVFRRFVHLPVPAMLTAAFGLIGVGLSLIGWVTDDLAFTAAAFVGLFGAGLLLPTLLTWTMRSLRYGQRGKGTAVYQSAFAAGQFGSSMVVPLLAGSLSGSILAAFAVLGGFAMTAAFAAFALGLLSPARPAHPGGSA
jgi:MFS family permease